MAVSLMLPAWTCYAGVDLPAPPEIKTLHYKQITYYGSHGEPSTGIYDFDGNRSRVESHSESNQFNITTVTLDVFDPAAGKTNRYSYGSALVATKRICDGPMWDLKRFFTLYPGYDNRPSREKRDGVEPSQDAYVGTEMIGEVAAQLYESRHSDGTRIQRWLTKRGEQWIPVRWHPDGSIYTLEFSDVRINEPIDEAVFQLPDHTFFEERPWCEDRVQ